MKEQVKINVLTETTIKSPFANGYCKMYFLELEYNNKKYDFDFTGSVYDYEHGNAFKSDDALYGILMDLSAYDNTQNIDDFAAEFGYDKVSELLNAYNGCKKTSEALHEIFTDVELEQLKEEFQDY